MAFNLSEQEWLALKDEALGLVAETRQIEKFTIALSGGVYAWLVTNEEQMQSFGVLPWLIPSFLVLFGSIRCWAIAKQVKEIGKYLLILEEELGTERSQELGWEKFFKPGRGYVFRTTVYFWLLLYFVTWIAIPKLASYHF